MVEKQAIDTRELGSLPSPVRRIVLTGDVFRTYDDCLPNQLQNVLWLYRTIGWQLARVSRLVPEIRFLGADITNAPRLGYPELFGAFGLDPSISSWARVFWESSPPDRCVELLAPDYTDALVIAFEMPPVLQAVLDRLGAPWIDVCISPLRFLSDLAVTFRFSRHFDSEALKVFSISDLDVGEAVREVRRYFGRWRNRTPRREIERSTVFFAQTERDRTLIRDGGFVVANDVRDHLVGQKRLLVKPHPFAPQNPIVTELVASGATILNSSTYGVLASTTDIRVLTISSSVAIEARAFGKTATTLSPKVLEYTYSGLTTLNGYRTSDFWHATLSQVMLTDTSEAFIEPFQSNRLRDQLSYFAMPKDLWA
ncbi:MAG: hypothetical protein EOP24_16480 [Hyphomicrobiales bacterium]|nr:MAG: hypothetical protein EOP24_16480 [Hyphomicrobiales bacterium]